MKISGLQMTVYSCLLPLSLVMVCLTGTKGDLVINKRQSEYFEPSIPNSYKDTVEVSEPNITVSTTTSTTEPPAIVSTPISQIPIINATEVTVGKRSTPEKVYVEANLNQRDFVATAYTKDPTSQPFSDSFSYVQNAVKGKPHILCNADSVTFITEFRQPFLGAIYAEGKRTARECEKWFKSPITEFNFTFPYQQCGNLIGTGTQETTYSVEVVILFEPPGHPDFTQIFRIQCVSQQLHYETEPLPIKIDEAIEELNITPIHIESRAQMPQCRMRIVPESDETSPQYRPSDNNPVKTVNIGDKLRIEWSLTPKSAAFGFLITNCTVQDQLTGRQHQVIDDKGCSNDLNILAHPHYDSYGDLAIVHWHAFKVPDNTILSFVCACHVCNDITDDKGQSGCGELPSPPYCPKVELVEQKPNSILSDFSRDFNSKNLVQNLPVATEVKFIRSFSSLIDNSTDSSTWIPELTPAERHILTVQKSKRLGDFCMSKSAFASVISLTCGFVLITIAFAVASAILQRRKVPKIVTPNPPNSRQLLTNFLSSRKKSSTQHPQIGQMDNADLSSNNSSSDRSDFYSLSTYFHLQPNRVRPTQ